MLLNTIKKLLRKLNHQRPSRVIGAFVLVVLAVVAILLLTSNPGETSAVDNLAADATLSPAQTEPHAPGQATDGSQNEQDGSIDANGSQSEASPTPTPVPVMLPRMKELYEQNDDIVGWLKIDGTVVDYPVMWTPPEMDDFYLYRTFDKKDDPTKKGTLFVDKYNSIDPRDTNLLIHGHNMKNGTMFNVLLKYADEDFFKKHPTFTYSTLYEESKYEIVAVFKSRVFKPQDDVFKYYKFYGAETEEEFDDFIENIKALQLYDTGAKAEFGDYLVTLSTCEYSVADGRFVVVGRAIN